LKYKSLVMIGLINVFLVGCGSTAPTILNSVSRHDRTQVETAIQKVDFHALLPNFLPFKPEQASAVVTIKPTQQNFLEKIVIRFQSGKEILSSSQAQGIWSNSGSWQVVKLQNGLQAYFIQLQDASELAWNDPNGTSFILSSQIENGNGQLFFDLSEKQLIQIASSYYPGN